MIKSKVKLHFNTLVLGILFLAIIYSFIVIKKQVIQSYDSESTNISGIITHITIDGNKLTIELKAQEKLIINYYIKTYNEMLSIKNDYHLGARIEATGTMKVPAENSVFNLFNYKKYLLSKKIYWLFAADKITLKKSNKYITYKIKNIIINRIEKIKHNKDYLYAFILGDSHFFEEDIISSFQKNGITHLFAISGANILLLATILKRILVSILKNNKLIYLYVFIFLAFYTFLVGSTPSVLRAVTLYITVNINKLFKLNFSPKFLFLLVLAIFLFYNPYYIYNLGFLLSFIISFYIIFFKEYLDKINNYIYKTFFISLIAFLASLPIIISNFFEINILTPVLNIIFIPFVSFIVFPASIITFIVPKFAVIFSKVIVVFEQISLYCTENLSINLIFSKPSNIIFLLYLIFTFYVISCLCKRKYRAFILYIIILIVHYNSNYFYKYPTITFIDVGQGDATLITLPHNKGAILIDTGGLITFNQENWQKRSKEYSLAKNVTIPYLKSLGLKKLDYLILTHGDSDHAKEAVNMIKDYKIEQIIFNSGHNNQLEQNIIIAAENKQIPYHHFNKNVININGYSLAFLNNKNSQDENKDSLIILTKINEVNILLMGDATKTEELSVLKEYSINKMDILKVGHHGSNTSTDNIFIKTIKPKVAIISAGKNNRYGHPHQETLDVLKQNQVKIYGTNIDGSIKIILNNNLTTHTCLSAR